MHQFAWRNSSDTVSDVIARTMLQWRAVIDTSKCPALYGAGCIVSSVLIAMKTEKVLEKQLVVSDPLQG